MPDNREQLVLLPSGMTTAITPSFGASIVERRAPRPHNRVVEAILVAGSRPRNMFGIVLATLAVLCAWPVAVTIPFWLVGLGAFHYAGAVTADVVRAELRVRAGRPFTLDLRPEVAPEEIKAHDLRRAYEGILVAYDELRRNLAAAPAIQPYLRASFERCAAVVQSAGRLARLGNPIDGYDLGHDRYRMLEELNTARMRAESVADPQAARLYRETAATRQRQVDVHDRLHDLRDRICARLDLVRATIETVVAMVVKLAVVDGEAAELMGEPLAAQLQRVGDEVALLESTLDEELVS
jgi:hypothetical protein